MSGFKRLLDAGQGALDELCRRFVRFYRYAKILKTIVEEIFYSFDVFHGANIQPDLQYILNPGGYKSATNMWVFGIQLSVPL
jgi:carbohydrate-selective porin OprB